MVPLATYPEINNWDYDIEFSKEFNEIGNFVKENNRDFDVMLEAKNKDNALFHLMKELDNSGKVKILNASTIEV